LKPFKLQEKLANWGLTLSFVVLDFFEHNVVAGIILSTLVGFGIGDPNIANRECQGKSYRFP
jgi:hypothetical protein